MSRAYVVLGLTICATIGTITYVHYDQERELVRMRKGVFADAIREQTRRNVLAAAALSNANSGDEQCGQDAHKPPPTTN